jgi:hypothetical protein
LAGGAGALYFDMAELAQLLQAEHEQASASSTVNGQRSTANGQRGGAQSTAAAAAAPRGGPEPLMGAGGASLLHPPGGGRVKPVESTPRPVHPHKRWQRQFHPDSGEAYYVDVDTGVTSWVASEPTAPTAAAAPNPAAPAPELAQRQLELEAVAAAAAQPPERMRKQQVRAVSWEPLTRRAAPR